MRQHTRRRAVEPRPVSALEVALAACRELVPEARARRPNVRRAQTLARFAIAMTK